jgi:predicted ATP-grasp superfamily ATP-dependent carboligase
VHDICTEFDIPTPWTAFPETRADIENLVHQANFPLVVKNVETFHRLRTPAVPHTTVVQRPAELLALASQWRETPGVMLQEYVAPADGDDWIFHAYCDEASDALVAFTGVKYRSWPPRTGVTTYGRAVQNDELRRLGSGLCKRVGFRGIADLDWRFDRRDGRYKLVDFNPRLGAQFRLFETDAGVDVVLAMHLDFTARSVPPSHQRDGRGFVLEHLDAPARLAYRRLAGGTAPSHESGPIERGWYARDDLVPFAAMTARLPSLVAARLRRR